MRGLKNVWCVCVLVCVGPAAAVRAGVVYVDGSCGDDAWTGASAVCAAPDGPKATIQAGINAAISGVDEVVVAPGTYNEKIIFNGKAITVRSTGGAAVTIIDGTGLNDSAVRCISGEGPATVLQGFTITGGSGFQGGGMRNENSSPTVINCIFSGNPAGLNGGGMYNRNADPTVTNCTFSGNSARNNGGGMLNGGLSGGSSNPTVTNCSFIGNTAVLWGGGMYSNSGSKPKVTNCVFSGNSALNGGGMIITVFSTSPEVTNCTFAGNTATGDGGGVFYHSGNLTVRNCIFWGNSDSGGVDQSAQIHLSGGNVSVEYSCVLGGWSGVGNIASDPRLVSISNGLLNLLPGSPAIDAGDNAAVPVGIITDLDGRPRFYDDPSMPDTGAGTAPIVDMGAYEFTCGGSPQADFDGDGDTDVNDFLTFSNCLNGAMNPPKPACESVDTDLDCDGDVDTDDFLTFSSCFNGSNNPPACP